MPLRFRTCPEPAQALLAFTTLRWGAARPGSRNSGARVACLVNSASVRTTASVRDVDIANLRSDIVVGHAEVSAAITVLRRAGIIPTANHTYVDASAAVVEPIA